MVDGASASITVSTDPREGPSGEAELERRDEAEAVRRVFSTPKGEYPVFNAASSINMASSKIMSLVSLSFGLFFCFFFFSPFLSPFFVSFAADVNRDGYTRLFQGSIPPTSNVALSSNGGISYFCIVFEGLKVCVSSYCRCFIPLLFLLFFCFAHCCAITTTKMTVKTIEPIATPIRVRYEETDLGVSNAVMLLLSRTNVGAAVVGSGVVDASIGCVEDADDVHVVDHVE